MFDLIEPHSEERLGHILREHPAFIVVIPREYRRWTRFSLYLIGCDGQEAAAHILSSDVTSIAEHDTLRATDHYRNHFMNAFLQRKCECEVCDPNEWRCFLPWQPPERAQKSKLATIPIFTPFTIRVCAGCGETPIAMIGDSYPRGIFYNGLMNLKEYIEIVKYVSPWPETMSRPQFFLCKDCKKRKSPLYHIFEEEYSPTVRRFNQPTYTDGSDLARFLRFKLWQKYRVKEPKRKEVQRAGERYFRRHNKKLSKHESEFFRLMLGANAIRRAYERSYPKPDSRVHSVAV